MVELLEVLRLVEVLAVDQGEEFRMFEVVGPGELDQRPDRFFGVQVLEVEVLLGAANVEERLLDHRPEQVLLPGEVVVDHPLVRLGAPRNRIDTGPAETEGGEFVPGGFENSPLGPFGVALPDRPRASAAGLSRRRWSRLAPRRRFRLHAPSHPGISRYQPKRTAGSNRHRTARRAYLSIHHPVSYSTRWSAQR